MQNKMYIFLNQINGQSNSGNSDYCAVLQNM